MRYGSGQLDVAHPLTSYLGLGYLNSAAVAYEALVLDPLILTAVAFPVLHGSEDPLAEEAVSFGLQGPVVDGFGLGYLAV